MTSKNVNMRWRHGVPAGGLTELSSVRHRVSMARGKGVIAFLGDLGPDLRTSGFLRTEMTDEVLCGSYL